MDRDDGTCDGKELGSMEIMGLGELLFGRTERSTMYGAGLTREPRPKDPKVLPDVKLLGLRTESRLYWQPKLVMVPILRMFFYTYICSAPYRFLCIFA